MSTHERRAGAPPPAALPPQPAEPIGWQATLELPLPDDALPPPARHPPLRSALGFAFGFGVAATVSLLIGRQPGTIAAIGFANSIGVVYLLFRPLREWPLPVALIALVTLLVHRAAGDGWIAAAAYLPPNLAEIVVGALLLRRIGMDRSALRGAGPLLRLWLFGGLLPQLVGATLGALLTTTPAAGPVALTWLHWLQGALIGALSVLAPTFMLWRFGARAVYRPLLDWRALTLVPLALGVALLCLGHVPYPFVYLGLPLMLAAMTVEFAVVALTTLAVSVVIAIALATAIYVPPPIASEWQSLYVHLAYAAALVPAQLLAASVAELRDSHARLSQHGSALRRSNEALEQFVRIASHDLREPLNTVVQFSGLIEQDHGQRLPGDARHYLVLVRGAAERMRTLLDDVLQYARLQGGPLDGHEPVALDGVMAEVRSSLAARLHDTGARLRVSPLPVVRGHPALLSLLLQNLVANALKFVPAGRRPEVDVSARVDGFNAWVTVTDNGIGIAPADQPKLFRPFQRLNLRRQYEGTGLGLALCSQIAQAHDGDIHVASVLGEGSRFTVRLPLA